MSAVMEGGDEASSWPLEGLTFNITATTTTPSTIHSGVRPNTLGTFCGFRLHNLP